MLAKLPDQAVAAAPAPAVNAGYAPATPPLEPPRLSPQPKVKPQ